MLAEAAWFMDLSPHKSMILVCSKVLWPGALPDTNPFSRLLRYGGYGGWSLTPNHRGVFCHLLNWTVSSLAGDIHKEVDCIICGLCWLWNGISYDQSDCTQSVCLPFECKSEVMSRYVSEYFLSLIQPNVLNSWLHCFWVVCRVA